MASNNVKPSIDEFQKHEILDQLRQTTALNEKEISETISRNITRQVLSSDAALEIAIAAAMDDTVNKLAAKRNQKRVFVKELLSKEDQDKLRRTFCMFNLDFTKASNCSGHPFWRAHRKLSEMRMLNSARITPTCRPSVGYDVVYKDVGGNPTTHFSRNEEYVHTCAPLLSNNDDKRRSAYKEVLRRTDRDNKCVRLHLEQNSRVICNRRSQNCAIKAEVLIFLHSSYDMSAEDIADSMHRADARVAYGCFHFNPRVLYEKEGKLSNGMYFKKLVVNGRLHIRFWFENDNQEGYEHDYLTYLSLVRTFRIKSTCKKNPRYYNVQFDVTEDDTTFFTIRHSDNGNIPRSNPYRVFTNENLKDKLIVYTWHWDTLNPGNFSSSNLSRMRPVRLIVPRKLFHKMCSFADTLPDSKFTVKNILIAGTSFNTREVITGQNVGVVESIEPSDLKLLAVAVYVITYVSNYESTQCLSNLIDDESRVRDESDNSFLSRLTRVRSRLPWADRVRKFQTKQKHLMQEMNTIRENLSEEDDPTTGNVKYIINKIKSVSAVERKFSITIERMCNFLTVEEELECLEVAEGKGDRGFIETVPLAEFIDPQVVRDAVIESFEKVTVRHNTYGAENFDKCMCLADLEVHPNDSNGHCVFQSMLDSGSTCSSVTEIRNKLLNSNHITSLKNPALQRKLLDVYDGSEKGFGDLETFILYSLEFDQGVCIHTNGLTQRFGSAPYKHFQIRDCHCTWLKPLHTLDQIPVSKIVECDETDYTSANRDKQFSEFFSLKKNYTASAYKRRLYAAKVNYCPLSELGDGNYVCRSGLKTAEMFTRFFTNDIESAFSIGGPGGEVEFLCDRGIRTFGATKTDLIDFSPAVRHHLFTQLLGDTYDGDITDLSNIISFGKSVRKYYSEGVDFFGGDAADSSRENEIDLKSMSHLLSWEILCCITVLKEGGCAYFKVFDLLSHKNPSLIHYLHSHFDDVQVVKLETSRSASTELHIICRGFIRECAVKFKNDYVVSDCACPTPFSNSLRHVQKSMDEHIAKGLHEYRRAFNTAGDSGQYINRFPLEKLEGYRALLCRKARSVSAGGIVSRVKRACHNIFSFGERNLDDELRTLLERTESVESFVTAEDSCVPAIQLAEDGMAIEVEEYEIAKPVTAMDCLWNLFEDRRCFEQSTEKDRTFTQIGQTNPLGITPYPRRIANLPPATVDLVVKPTEHTDPQNVVVESPVSVVEKPVDCRDSMRECLELTKYTLQCEISNHRRILRNYEAVPLRRTLMREEVGMYTLLEINNGSPRVVSGHPIEGRNFNKYFLNEDFHSFSGISNLENGTVILVSEYCEIALEQELIRTYESIDIESFALPSGTGIVQAGPGCGKTTYVVNNSVPPHVSGASNVLLATTEGKYDYIDRLQKKYNRIFTKDQLSHVRTLASFLVNPHKNVKSSVLIIDEALMSHPGQIFFAISLSGATTVKLLGDRLQIPFVNRTPAFPTKFDKLPDFVPVVETLYISYRCRTDVVARLDAEYLKCNAPLGVNKGLMSVHYSPNTCKVVKICNDDFPKDPNVQYLVFTQPEKTILKNLKLHVSTVHEYQGKEAKEIRVVRLNAQPQTEIYKRFNYALVALTRHTEKLTYYTRVTDDALSKLIKVDGITCHTAMSEDDNRKCHYKSAGRAQPQNRDTFKPVARDMTVRVKAPTIPVYDTRRNWDNVRAGVADTEVFRIARPEVVSGVSTVAVTPAHISKVQDCKLYFVPRYGVKPDCPFKPIVMENEVHVETRKGHKNFYVVSSNSADQNHNLCTITKNLKKLNSILSDHSVSKIYVSGDAEKCIDRSALGYALHKHLRVRSVLCSNMNIFDTPSEVFDLLTKNGMNDLPNSSFDSYSFSIPEVHVPLRIKQDFSPESAQSFINNFFGECAFEDQSFDAWDVRNSDLDLEMGQLTYAPVLGVQLNRRFDNLRPILKTPMPHMRDYNTRELMLALQKRNRNVPYMNGTVDFDKSSDEMLDNLLRECFDPALLEFHTREPVSISCNSVSDWLSGQPPAVKGMIVPSFAMHCSALNSYSFSIKRKPKPNLTVDATRSYLALQTIVYHEKPINAMFCSVFREIKKRVTSSLLPHVKIFCDMSAEEFEEILNRDIPIEKLHKILEKLEIDISKYDKSQRELALEFECKLMRRFGVSEDIIELWYNAHILTEVYDRNTKLKALIPYQRKSGDASTFIGNTLFLMAVISDLIPISQMDLALFSGDDSLIYGLGLKKYKNAQHFGLKFNLEIKFFEFEHSYFCSKFLLPVNGRWRFTPCPVKFMTKLGRHDMVNFEHVEQYRVSFADTVKNYADYHVCAAVAVAVKERFGIFTDFTNFFSSLTSMVLPENFKKLFFSEKTDVIDDSATFSLDF
nr:hypothetical protein 1 [San Bernardo virus]AQM55439.1 hypothetical protein 1 [San Bernardo virus]